MQLSTTSIPPEINSAAAGPAPLPDTAACAENAAAAFDRLYPDLAPGRAASGASTAKTDQTGMGDSAAPRTGRGLNHVGINLARATIRPAPKKAAAADAADIVPTAAGVPADTSTPIVLPGELPGAGGVDPSLTADTATPAIPAPAILVAARGAKADATRGTKAAEAGPVLPGGVGGAEAPADPGKSDPAILERGADQPGGAGAHKDQPTGAIPVIAGQGEKFAESGASSDQRNDSDGRGADKKILNVLDKQVAEPDPVLGTAVAKAASVMSASSLSPHPLTAAPISGLQAEAANAPAGLPPVPQPALVAGAAHRAVDAVMAAADRLGTEGQHTVNLQFSLSGADLSVRVELRQGAVHATFRTDSSELRSALAHEWQAVSGETPDHPLRMAAPVFAAKDATGFGSSTGDPAQQQRNPGARPAAEVFSLGASRAGRRISGASAAVPAAATESASRMSTLSLHAFA